MMVLSTVLGKRALLFWKRVRRSRFENGIRVLGYRVQLHPILPVRHLLAATLHGTWGERFMSMYDKDQAGARRYMT